MKFLIIISLGWLLCSEVISDKKMDISNYCMDALYHKEAPGPEAELFGEVNNFHLFLIWPLELASNCSSFDHSVPHGKIELAVTTIPLKMLI